MSLFTKLAVGIDLGTTYSAVAYLDEAGRPTTLLSAEGDLLTPSVVLFDEGQVVVGKEALKAMATEANQVADCAKLELGRRTFHKVIGGRKYPPEVIEAWILSKLRSDAMERIGDFHQVVITVPAYFDEVRRKATQDAGFMAGLDVLDIINEPTSAAIAYGSQRGFLNSKGTASDAVTVLVYDLGGGTFDVTVMEINGSDFTTLATDGDVRLGGRDWDQRLTNHVAEEFIREHQIDPREDPNTAARLWRDCEDAKRTLSARTKASVACDYKGSAIRMELTRAVFVEITRDLVDRTRFTTRQTLKAAGLTWKEIDHVLLVGGSSRMPMIRQMLAELSGMEPDTSVAADEAVAHGAAVRAGVVLAQQAGQHPPLSIKNVNSHSLGVVGTDPVSQLRRSAVLIPRNTPLPVTAKRIFKTQKANQKTILVPIVEGESPSPDDCTPIGKCVVRNLPPNLPVDTAIEVMFRYEENGRLAIEVRVGGTNKELMHEITRENSLSQEQLDSWRQYITQGQVEREQPAETPGTDKPGSGPAETDPQDTRWA